MEAEVYHTYLIKLGKNIRQLRKKRSMSMETLAYEANIEYRLVGRIERGEGNTTIISLIKIAQALQLELKDLLDF